MGFYKKTVLLSNQANYQKGMAILSIEQSGSGVFGSIKAFDIPKSNNLVLGISIDGVAVVKQNVSFVNDNIFTFKLSNNFDINGKIGCVLASINDDNVNVLVWGSNGSQAEYKNNIINIFEKDLYGKNTAMQSIKNYGIQDVFNDAVHNETKPIISNDGGSSECQSELFEDDDKEIEKIIDNELREDNFFEMVGEQIDELFKRFPVDEKLNNMIPNSKWIRVDYENNGKVYVLGIIYDRGDVKYICYGVPSRFDVAPPPELQPYSQWLQLEGDDGFWVMYQDATTGDSIIIDDISSL